MQEKILRAGPLLFPTRSYTSVCRSELPSREYIGDSTYHRERYQRIRDAFQAKDKVDSASGNSC